MKARIEAHAWVQRQEKKREFERLKDTHNMWIGKYYASAGCNMYTREEDGIPVSYHSHTCLRCGYLDNANSLQIDMHEWPLPQDDLEAQSTVFEFSVPVIFSKWRDSTLYFINDVLLSRPSETHYPQSSHPLRKYSSLSEYFRTDKGHRVHLLSETKPNIIDHPRRLYVHNCTESDVCVNNGLRYQYFDESQGWFLKEFLTTESISHLCTFSLPSRAHDLRRFLMRTWRNPEGTTPNEVVASQSTCPEYRSLSEYKALAELPYGYNIQWQSILNQLAMPRIDINKMETALFLLQMSFQAGPRSLAATRCTHTRLGDREFGQAMLGHLAKGVSRIRENWEPYTTLCSFTFLASRVLSQVPRDLAIPFVDLVDECRAVAYRWLAIVLERAQATTDEVHRRGLLGVVLNVALAFVGSFNIEDCFLAKVLEYSDRASILLECSVIIHNNAPVQISADDPLQTALFGRWRHTMHRARDVIVRQNALGNSCFNIAVKRCWPAFAPVSTWALDDETCRWLQTTTHEGLQVHLDTLTGELLVNGSPIARLPREYERHDSYKRLFGGLVLEVMPSNLPGMRFCTTQLFQGNTIHFAMQDHDLLIRLEANSSRVDLIPLRTIRGLLPHSFVDGYAHWYYASTDIVELRPLSDPWAKNSSNLFLSRLGEVWTLRKGTLYIHVPRLQLDFFIKAGESIIRPRQFRGMHIDQDHDFGLPVRMLIVPEGHVQFQRASGKVNAAVAYGTAQRVQNYRIDKLLRRLVANTKLESKLFLAYIHALTSFCLPDPFLGRTGTEESIRLLGSASVRAPGPLSTTEQDRLQTIASLSPVRDFYPKHERVMQQVSWSSNLGFLAQDDRFYTIAKGIIDRSTEVGFLYPDIDRPGELSQNTIQLVERAIIRKARQCVSGYCAEDFSVQHDVIYQSRDNGFSDRATRAAEMAVRAYRGHASLLQPVSAELPNHLYTLLSHGTIPFPRTVPPEDDLLYDSKWLSSPTTFLSAYWCQLHQAFQNNHTWLNKFKLIVWIATVAYSSKYDQQITQALLSIALSSSISTVSLPSQISYDLSEGYEVVKTKLGSIVDSAALSFDETPAAHLIIQVGNLPSVAL
ncbi:hypothetical protein FSPOR_10776 [Fusarium sporotrichioides]|uniref:ubiquitinyl hydrolase 1 n=1 Tax=Fusarium sporotrichioides TaxID=5514 RepID=A0A395RJA4_FUSSP|nr:hypothetical protein FSPOR_10776 [Fusarium sporotrichioides]